MSNVINIQPGSFAITVLLGDRAQIVSGPDCAGVERLQALVQGDRPAYETDTSPEPGNPPGILTKDLLQRFFERMREKPPNQEVAIDRWTIDPGEDARPDIRGFDWPPRPEYSSGTTAAYAVRQWESYARRLERVLPELVRQVEGNERAKLNHPASDCLLAKEIVAEADLLAHKTFIHRASCEMASLIDGVVPCTCGAVEQRIGLSEGVQRLLRRQRDAQKVKGAADNRWKAPSDLLADARDAIGALLNDSRWMVGTEWRPPLEQLFGALTNLEIARRTSEVAAVAKDPDPECGDEYCRECGRGGPD